jgi:hypothetical protein
VSLTIYNGADGGYIPRESNIYINTSQYTFVSRFTPSLCNIRITEANNEVIFNTSNTNWCNIIPQLQLNTYLDTNWNVQSNYTLHIPNNQNINPETTNSNVSNISFIAYKDIYYFIRARFRIYDLFGNFAFGNYSSYVNSNLLSNTYTFSFTLRSSQLIFPAPGYGWATDQQLGGSNYLGYMPPPSGVNGTASQNRYNGPNWPGGGDTISGKNFSVLRYILLNPATGYPPTTLPRITVQTLTNTNTNSSIGFVTFNINDTVLWTPSMNSIRSNFIFRVSGVNITTTNIFLTAYYSINY